MAVSEKLLEKETITSTFSDDTSEYKMINVAISNFEGPLDLLCFLISKNKMDIFDISLVELTDRYIEYLSAMQQLDMEIATEFLVMATTLLYLKSYFLLDNSLDCICYNPINARFQNHIY